MTVRQKFITFMLGDNKYKYSKFMVIKSDISEDGNTVTARHYFVTFDELIGMFGFYEFAGIKPAIGINADFIVNIVQRR